jgi:DNA-binding transcriptional MerR regulator
MKKTSTPTKPNRANLSAINEAGNKSAYYVTDVAEMLGLSKRTIRYYVKQGWLKPVQYNSVRLQFTQKSLKDLQVIMEERMAKERNRRSNAMKEMRREQMTDTSKVTA